jgi:hypothetical protein
MVLSFSFPPRDCVALLAAPDKKLIGDCRWNESQKRKEEEEADGAFFFGEREGGGIGSRREYNEESTWWVDGRGRRA